MSKKNQRQAERRKRIKDAVRLLKEADPCADCQQSYPYYVMHFDHRGDVPKKAGVGQLASEQSLAKVLEEIEKCDLVCANCHAIRTYKRINGLLA